MAEPAYKERMGQVSLTVWKNEREGNNGTFSTYDVVIERNYKDKDDNWKTTSKFQLNDLMKVQILARKGYEWVHNDKTQKQ